MNRGWAWPASLGLVLLAVTLIGLPFATGHAGHGVELAVQPDGCGANTTVCFQLRTVPVDARAGEQVEMTLHNPGNADSNHTVYVTNGANGDPQNGTSTGVAIGRIGPISPGETGTTMFTVPQSETVYLWCALDDHEAEGMHKRVPLSVDAATGGDSSPSPAPGWSAVMSLVGGLGVAVALSRA